MGYFGAHLITGVLVGAADEDDCEDWCQPDEETLRDCEENESLAGTWDYDACECIWGTSPILIDMDNDGLQLTNPEHGVTFDINGTGTPVKVAWTSSGSNDAFLALDRNHNGLIDDGSELFGNRTAQPPANGGAKKKSAPNGFLALAVYDDPKMGGNGDGQITEEDAIYADLRLWIDANHDGISQPSELKSLADAGIRSISLRYEAGKKRDAFGNLYEFRSHVLMDGDLAKGGLVRRAVDVVLMYIAP